MFDFAKDREDIERRNRLRAEVLLPPLSMARELRKLFNAERKHDSAEREAEFESFFNTSPLRKRIEARLLARHRRLRQDPEWKPTGFLSGGRMDVLRLHENRDAPDLADPPSLGPVKLGYLRLRCYPLLTDNSGYHYGS